MPRCPTGFITMGSWWRYGGGDLLRVVIIMMQVLYTVNSTFIFLRIHLRRTSSRGAEKFVIPPSLMWGDWSMPNKTKMVLLCTLSWMMAVHLCRTFTVLSIVLLNLLSSSQTSPPNLCAEACRKCIRGVEAIWCSTVKLRSSIYRANSTSKFMKVVIVCMAEEEDINGITIWNSLPE